MTLEAIKIIALLCSMPAKPTMQMTCQDLLAKCVVEERVKRKDKIVTDGMLLEICMIKEQGTQGNNVGRLKREEGTRLEDRP